MTTAQQIISDSMERASIISVGGTATASDNAKAFTLLQEMLDSWKNEGIDLQISLSLVSDTVYLDKSDILCIKVNLAVMLADAYKLPLPQSVFIKAVQLYDSLGDKYLEANTEEMELPDMLSSQGRVDINTDS